MTPKHRYGIQRNGGGGDNFPVTCVLQCRKKTMKKTHQAGFGYIKTSRYDTRKLWRRPCLLLTDTHIASPGEET